MPTTFRDILFPPQLSWGIEGGPEFETDVTVTGSGFEFRNANWAEERGRWDVAHRIKEEIDKDLLFAFFRASKGRNFTFRFKDWLEYTAVQTEFATGDGVTKVFDLYITSDDGGGLADSETLKRIALPVDTTVYTTEFDSEPFKLYNDAVLVSASNYTVDYRNGKVTYTTGEADQTATTILANEDTGDYWIEGGATTITTGRNVNDRIVISGFLTAGNNTAEGTYDTIQEVDVPGNRIRIDNVVVDEAAGPSVTISDVTDVPQVAEVLTWTGHFHKPARFDVDRLEGTLVNHNLYNFNDIPIVEVRANEIIIV